MCRCVYVYIYCSKEIGLELRERNYMSIVCFSALKIFDFENENFLWGETVILQGLLSN